MLSCTYDLNSGTRIVQGIFLFWYYHNCSIRTILDSKYRFLIRRMYEKCKLLSTCTPWTVTYPGGRGGAAPSLPISRKKGSFFKTSACPRFCKRRVLFRTQERSMGVKIPLQSTKYTRLWRRVTPEVTGLPSLLPLNTQRIIKSKVKICVPDHLMSVFW